MKIAISIPEKEKPKGPESPYFRALVAGGARPDEVVLIMPPGNGLPSSGDFDGIVLGGGEDVDPEVAQAHGPGQAITAGQHDDRVMSAVGDHGHDRDLGAQREPDEALPPAEVDLIALSPRAAGLQVPARVHDHAGSAR